MRYFKHIANALCMAALGVMALTGCEGADQYSIDSPDWIKNKVDSINNAKQPHEEVLEGMQEDVYTIGKTDFSSGWWSAFSKYYVIGENQKWNAQFNLNINPGDNTYYKNFALIITNDFDRGATDYKEYGAIRFDATGDSAKYNSQWGNLFFKYTNSTMLLDPQDNKDANVQKLGGKVTLTVDRSRKDSFVVKMSNGVVTKTYTQPYALNSMNADASDTNIRCFIAVEGSYIDFLSTNIVPVGGLTSAEDKQPLSMTLNNVPETVDQGTSLDDAMQNVSAEVTFEEGVKKTVPAAELYFSAIPDMNDLGEKTLVVIYNKTFKGENCSKPIVANAKFTVVPAITKLEVTKAPTNRRYYFYTSAATSGMTARTIAFDPTGMQVTATYKDGTSGVVDNSKLTFSAVPATVGTHDVTISSVNGTTTTTRVRVAESTSTLVTVTPSVLGAEDNSSAWWSAHLDADVKVPEGETRQFSFTNYTSGANNWNNWVIVLRNTAKAEYGVLRSDNYGWGNGYSAVLSSGGQSDWATWLAAMNGAKVNIFVTNVGNSTADVQAVMKGTDGKTYVQYYLGVNTVNPNDLNVDFTVDGCHLVFSNTALAKKHAHRR